MPRHSLENVNIKGIDETLEIIFDWTPGEAGRHTLSNGDPGYPPTNPEAEIYSITDQDGKEREDLFETHDDQILEYIYEHEEDFI